MNPREKAVALAKTSTSAGEGLAALAKTDISPEHGGASDKIRNSSEYQAKAVEFHKAFKEERKFNSSPEGKAFQQERNKLSIVERQKLRKEGKL